MQTDSRTVEGEFVATCKRLSLFDDWREAGFSFAGRTDRGVHARGQVAAFTTEAPGRAVQTINTQLPPDCWCTGYAKVGAAFHPRYDALARTYRYYFPETPEDVPAMQRAAVRYVGNHNFTNFARVGDKNPLRKIHAAHVGNADGFLFFEVTADSFLWHQVRCMAAALILVGNGEANEDSITRWLERPVERPIQPAPAEGLILWNVDCGFSWISLSESERSTKFMDHLRRHHALMENVCCTLKKP
jgi:tRNA pseudouridine38-40 synthase